MSLSSGVAGVVDALREIVHPSHAGAQLLHLLLALLRRLVHEQHVHLRPLKAQRVLVVVAVAEQYPAAVGEDDVLFPVVVACYPLALVRVAAEHFAQRYDVVFLQLRVGLSYYHHLYPRVPQAQQHRLDPHRPALPAAPRPAVAYVLVPICHKQTLLLARLRYPQLRHSPSSPINSQFSQRLLLEGELSATRMTDEVEMLFPAARDTSSGSLRSPPSPQGEGFLCPAASPSPPRLPLFLKGSLGAQRLRG